MALPFHIGKEGLLKKPYHYRPPNNAEIIKDHPWREGPSLNDPIVSCMLITNAELEFTSVREPFKRDLTHSKIQRGQYGVADVYRHDIWRSVR